MHEMMIATDALRRKGNQVTSSTHWVSSDSLTHAYALIRNMNEGRNLETSKPLPLTGSVVIIECMHMP